MDEDRVLAAIARLSSDLTDRIDRLEERLQTELKALRTEQGALRTEMGTLRTELRAEITEIRVALMDRMDRIEDRLTGMSDDIAVSMGAATTVLTRHGSLRTEVDSVTTTNLAMHRLIKRLQTDVEALQKKAS